MSKKPKHEAPTAPSVEPTHEPAPVSVPEPEPTVPVSEPAADAGARFARDRSGDPRRPNETEGWANFKSFSATLHAPTEPEAA